MQPGKRYRLTGWIRTSETNADGYLGVRGRTGVVKQKTFGSLPGYTQVTLDFSADDESLVEVYAGFWASGQDIWIQFDDVSLTRL